MVYHSDYKHLLQRLLLTLYQFSVSERQRISGCEHYYACAFFEEAGRDENSVSPDKTLLLICPLTQGSMSASFILSQLANTLLEENSLQLVVLVLFLLRGLNLIQENLKMTFSEPWNMGAFL